MALLGFNAGETPAPRSGPNAGETPALRSSVARAAAPVGLIALAMCATGLGATRHDAVDIGDRLEPFVDARLIGSLTNAQLRLTPPQRREVVLTLDKPWEGPASAYFAVFRDGDKVRMYYRGHCPADLAAEQVTCYAESSDGIRFARPELGLYDFGGNRANNIVYRGVEAHNFAPFRDTNPGAPPDAMYKAMAGVGGKLFAFVSPDGTRWRKLREEPVLTKGAFDSLNIAFWDAVAGLYRCYSRSWTGGGYAGIRAIQSATSKDFVTWTEPVNHRYAPGVHIEHFYTNATVPHPGAPHILLSFPKRFVPERTKLGGYKEPGVSDAVFMTSRDGTTWDRAFLEAWLRPGLDQRNWTQRSNMPAWGIVETGDEFSLYVSEHYDWPDCRIRRVTVPRARFAGIHGGPEGGTIITKPLTFSGHDLVLNYATSAAGSVVVEVVDDDGKPYDGFAANDFGQLYGDELEAVAKWRGKSLAEAPARPVRLRVTLRDADLYAIQTRR